MMTTTPTGLFLCDLDGTFLKPGKNAIDSLRYAADYLSEEIFKTSPPTEEEWHKLLDETKGTTEPFLVMALCAKPEAEQNRLIFSNEEDLYNLTKEFDHKRAEYIVSHGGSQDIWHYNALNLLASAQELGVITAGCTGNGPETIRARVPEEYLRFFITEEDIFLGSHGLSGYDSLRHTFPFGLFRESLISSALIQVHRLTGFRPQFDFLKFTRNCWYLADSPADVEAALLAHVRMFLFGWTEGEKREVESYMPDLINIVESFVRDCNKEGKILPDPEIILAGGIKEEKTAFPLIYPFGNMFNTYYGPAILDPVKAELNRLSKESESSINKERFF